MMTTHHVAAPEIVADGLFLPECPRWHDGRLWFSDVRGDQVYRVDNGHLVAVHRFPAHHDPAGLGFMPNGDLLIAGMTDRVVHRVAGGRADVFADLSSLATHKINDMVVTSDGTAYVTQFGCDIEAAGLDLRPTSIIKVDPAGGLSVAADGLMVPNGIAVTDDEKSLVVAESGASRLSSYTICDGMLVDRVEEPLPASEAAPFSAPDGMCLDEQGGRWIADPVNKRLIRLLDGVVTDEYRFDRFVLACVLGDTDRRSLYVCVTGAWGDADSRAQPTGRVLRIRVAVPGAGRP